MKGDFSRSTFDPHKHYRSVRMQQGRVQLDADWNEQADILLHLIATQLRDLLGPGGTTVTEPGFAISLDGTADGEPDKDQAGLPEGSTKPARTWPDFRIGAGRYYVDGILCENDAPVLYSQQPDYPAAASRPGEPLDTDHLLVYLDVWQRHISAAEDPTIREIALGGLDTTTRVKTVWQVKLLPLPGDPDDDPGWRERPDLSSLADWRAFIAPAVDKGQMQAKWDQSSGAFLENRLYRVEIHAAADDQISFKWSRENGSVVFPITAIAPSPAQEQDERTLRVTVEELERDPYQLQEGFWVELADDVTVLNGRPLPLCQITALDRPNNCVTLRAEKARIDPILAEIGARELQHPLLRRWEAEEKPIVRPGISAGEQGEGWPELEDGIQVAFSETGTYQVGDYWLVPARARSGAGIDWPQSGGQPLSQAPHGIAHHYAPLALLHFQDGEWYVSADEASTFRSLPQTTAGLHVTNKELEATNKELESMCSNLQGIRAEVFSLQRRVAELEEHKARIQEHIYHDFASKGPLEEGDVVALDPDLVDGVELASKENERRLVGVVTELIDDQCCRVALYGRVRCKVIGKVEPGDLLVPSREPGRAQKAGWYRRPGTLLGKALSLTDFDQEVVEEIEEGRLRPEGNMSKQPGTVDVLVLLGWEKEPLISH